MKPLSVSLAAAALLAASALPATVHAAQLSPEMRGQIEEVVKSYLLKNPEIIRDASAALAAREEAEKAAAVAQGTRREPGGAGARPGLTRWRQSPGRRHGGRVLRLQLRLLQAGGTCREGVDRGRCQCAGRLQGVPDPRPKLASGCKSGIGCAAAGQVRGVPRGAVRTARDQRGDARRALSGRLGLDHARLVKDMEGPEIAAQITRDTELARSLDINGTPGFVIGNRLVPGAIDTQTMQQIVEAERAAAKTRK